MLVHIDTLRSTKIPEPHFAATPHTVTFTKNELNVILSIYSYQVAKGKWRDYAIDFLKQMAVFSIFKNSAEQPLVSVVKIPGNTSSGYIYEVFFEKKRISRTAELATAIQALRDRL